MLRCADSSVKQSCICFCVLQRRMWNQQGSRYESRQASAHSASSLLLKLRPIFHWFFHHFCDKVENRFQRHHILRAELQWKRLEVVMPAGLQSGRALPWGARLVKKQLPWPTSLLHVRLICGCDVVKRAEQTWNKRWFYLCDLSTKMAAHTGQDESDWYTAHTTKTPHFEGKYSTFSSTVPLAYLDYWNKM